MSNSTVYKILRGEIMNLHEECLLKYLLNPLDLFYSTELLKLNNDMLEKGDFMIKKPQINCNTVRI